MKWGWAAWNMANAAEADKCRWTAEVGFDFVSFSARPADWSLDHAELLAARTESLSRWGLGWTAHVGLGPCDRPSKLAELAGVFEAMSEFARQAGPPLAISFDPGYVEGAAGKSYDEDGTIRGLDLAFGKLAIPGLRLAIENWPRCNSRPEDFARLGQHFPGLGMLLDVGHMNIHLGGRPGTVRGYVEALPLPIFDLHLHDNDGNGDQHLPLGCGNLAMHEVGRALAMRGYDGPATVEVCPGLEALDFNRPEDAAKVSRTLELARRHLASEAGWRSRSVHSSSTRRKS